MTNKKVTQKNKKISKKKLEEQKQLKMQKMIKIGGVVSAVIIFFIWFANSSYWPWPSSAEIGRRLDEVIDSCLYNERSRGCSVVQEKYNMSFEYCHALVDIPEIGKSIPVYGVAKKNDVSPREINDESGSKIPGKYPYYSCTKYVENMDKDNTENLLATEPKTLALFDLYKVPKKATEGNLNSCRTKQVELWGYLWNQIPNIEAIKNEYKIAFDANNMCYQLSNLQKEFDRINKKLSDYANNKTVQLYYSIYDKWNTDPRYGAGAENDPMTVKGAMYGGCTYVNKDFIQRCGTDGDSDDLEHFTKEMRTWMTTDEHSSKIVIQ